MRLLRRILCYTLAGALSMVLMPYAAWAAGKAVITPKIAANWRYDANFYRADTNERGVYTYLVEPGVIIGYDTGKTTALLDYTLRAYYYDDAEALAPGVTAANEENYIGHNLEATLRSQITDRVELGLDESLAFSRDAAETDRFNNSVARDKYLANRVIPSIYYVFGERFAASLRYQNYLINYDTGTREDYLENRGMFDLFYHFTRTTSLDLEYQYWQTDYSQTSSDYNSHQVKLIFRKQFNYFRFEVGSGYHRRDFDAAGLNSIETLSYHLTVLGQNPPLPETKPRSHVILTAEWNFNDLGTGDSYYKAHRISVEVGRIFFRKIPVAIGGTYLSADYETANRTDNIYTVTGRIGYLITRWLELSVGTGYESRDSTVNGNDYDNLYVIVRLELVYPLGKK